MLKNNQIKKEGNEMTSRQRLRERIHVGSDESYMGKASGRIQVWNCQSFVNAWITKVTKNAPPRRSTITGPVGALA